jgi:FkbM family methyltransferase
MATTLITPAGPLRFQDDDQVIAPTVAATGVWEPDEADRITELLWQRPGWLIDLGAHVGYHSAVQLSRLPNVKVLAVEANPLVYDLLRHNLRPWGERVTIVHGAAWCDSISKLDLWQHETGNGGDYRIALGNGDVPAVTVDDVATTHIGRAGRVSVIKSDLQGRDHIALRGATGTIALDRPDIVCEFDPAMTREAPTMSWTPDPLRVLEWYQRMNYQVCQVDGTPFRYLIDVQEYALRQPGGATTLWLQPTERAGR